MRTTLIAVAAFACAACATKNDANRPDSSAPAAATVAPGGPTPASAAELRHYADSLQKRYIEAATKGDVAALSGFYTNDAIVLAPNAKAVHGRAEIDKANTQMFSTTKVTALKLSTEDVQVAGDLGVETGAYEQTLTPKTGKPMHDVGKYIVVRKRQADGSWKLFREIYNTDLPPAKS